MVESPHSNEPEHRGKQLSIDQLPPDIFQEDPKGILPLSVSTPAENLKALVQECGVAPHKISELLHELPPRGFAEKLVDLYFTGRSVFTASNISSLTLIVQSPPISNWTRYPVSEKNFRQGCNSLYNEGAAINPNEFRFLPLLFVILAISVRLAPEHLGGDARTRRLTSSRYYWCCQLFCSIDGPVPRLTSPQLDAHC